MSNEKKDNTTTTITTTTTSTDTTDVIYDGTTITTITDAVDASDSVGWHITDGCARPLIKCASCKKEGIQATTYNWGDREDTQRNICDRCFCKYMDKIFNISPNRMKTEEVLYGDKK